MTSLDYARLADLYDACCRYDRDIPFFLDATRTVPGPVLELMAGTGRISAPLVRAGVSLVCVDREPAMLRVLAGKLAALSPLWGGNGSAAGTDPAFAADGGHPVGFLVPDPPQMICAEVGSIPLSRNFWLAILPFQGFSELLGEDEQRSALEEVHRLLAPGGRFLCTLHNPPARLRTIDGEWHELGSMDLPDQNGTIGIRIRATFDRSTRLVTGTQEIRRHAASGECVETRAIPLQCALPSSFTFGRLAASAGFEVKSIYGDYDRSPFDPTQSPFMIWVLRKSSSAGPRMQQGGECEAMEPEPREEHDGAERLR